jgi:hypothetical protein
MSPQQDPERFLRVWLDPFDFFPQRPVDDMMALAAYAASLPP